MLGLMDRLIKTPLHHFFDDRTDAASAGRAHSRPISTPVNTKTTARHRSDDKLLKFLKDL
jgi:hypothetical protein